MQQQNAELLVHDSFNLNYEIRLIMLIVENLIKVFDKTSDHSDIEQSTKGWFS